MNRPLCRGRVLIAGFVIACVSGLAIQWTLAGPPDLEFNQVTGFLESVDIAQESGSVVRHVIDKGPGKAQVVTWVSTDAGLEPRVGITTAGVTWAVWWKDDSTDEVLYRHRTSASPTWSSETVLSSSGENSRSPEIVHNGGSTFIVYEIIEGSTKSIATTGIIDTPEPFPQRTIIATTTYSGDVDVLAHSESSHVWLTWIDGTSAVGWSQYDSTDEQWTDPEYESYSADSIEDARSRIRAEVLGQ